MLLNFLPPNQLSGSPLLRPLLFAVHTGSPWSIRIPVTVHMRGIPLNANGSPALLLEWLKLLRLPLPSAGEDAEQLELRHTLLRT